ncbi:MAG: STAS domain-containing protein [Acidobacteria bacterium]|nr:STAS domain-containing protein [Acidobacteriota bacterium]
MTGSKTRHTAVKQKSGAGRRTKGTVSHKLQLVLDSELDNVERVEKLVNDFALKCGCGTQQCSEIELAVRETVINAIIHGNQKRRTKKVHVKAELNNSDLTISVRDEGNGFDPGAVPDPTKPENLMRDSGRGILLMQTLMDRLSIRPVPGKGTEVRMVKKIARNIDQQTGEEHSMSLKLSSRQVDGVTVLDFEGRIILGEPTEAIRDALQDLVSKGQKKILLNLGEVSYIDSSGLGALVRGYSTLASQQGALKLLNLTKKVEDLLQVTKLYTVFEIFNDESAAIKSFQ